MALKGWLYFCAVSIFALPIARISYHISANKIHTKFYAVAMSKRNCSQVEQNEISESQIYQKILLNSHELRWMAFLFGIKGTIQTACPGTIIHKNWILVAAHCVAEFSQEPSSIIILAGAYDLSILNPTSSLSLPSSSQTIPAEEVVLHPEYYSKGIDVALVKVKQEFIFTKHVHPIPLLPVGTRVQHLTHCTSAGWGACWNCGEGSMILRKVNAEIQFANLSVIYTMGNLGPGDSGAPLFCQDATKVYQLVGIFSRFKSLFPGIKSNVFAKTSFLNTWIRSTIGSQILDDQIVIEADEPFVNFGLMFNIFAGSFLQILNQSAKLGILFEDEFVNFLFSGTLVEVLEKFSRLMFSSWDEFVMFLVTGQVFVRVRPNRDGWMLVNFLVCVSIYYFFFFCRHVYTSVVDL